MVMGDTTASADVAVLGGGPGGYAAAFRAAQHGLDTALVTDEDEGLGGVCLHRGCIPSKGLLEMTGRLELARGAAEAGIHFNDPDIDVSELQSWTNDVVSGLVEGLGDLAEARGVRVIEGYGRFRSSSHLAVEGSDVTGIDFQHAIVATGSRPVALPDVSFEGPVWDSADALALDEVPNRLLVVGAGYVGLELGTVYARLGSSVTVVEAEDRILPLVDPELAEPLAGRLEDTLEDIRLGASVSSVEVEGNGVSVTVGGESARFDRVLVAVGRSPVTGDLGLEETGAVRDDDGYIEVDAERRTADEGIFAVGDCNGGMGLAHEAMREGKIAADVIAGEPAAWDVRAVPAVIYTDPQVAWCGLTEREGSEGDGEIRVSRFPLSASARARTMGSGAGAGLVKVIADAETDRILGVGMTGPHVESVVAETALAVEMGATATDVALTIHPHPTLSEAVGEAAEAVLGMPTHFTAAAGRASE